MKLSEESETRPEGGLFGLIKGEEEKRMLAIESVERKTKSIFELSTDEILQGIRELEHKIERPFVQLVLKTHIRRKKNRTYVYRYWYLQYRDGETVRTIYIGSKVSESVIERIRMQNRYKALKRELMKRIRGS